MLSASLTLLALGSGLGRGRGAAPADEPDVRPAITYPLEPCLEPLTFLTGTWCGTYRGDPVEETWSRAETDSIVGMLRWQTQGQAKFFELLTIKEEENKPVMRIRHFDEKFEPWQGECNAVTPFTLADVGGVGDQSVHRAMFRNETDSGAVASIEYSMPREGEMKIELIFKDPKRETLVFELKRRAGV